MFRSEIWVSGLCELHVGSAKNQGLLHPDGEEYSLNKPNLQTAKHVVP